MLNFSKPLAARMIASIEILSHVVHDHPHEVLYHQTKRRLKIFKIKGAMMFFKNICLVIQVCGIIAHTKMNVLPKNHNIL